jgi:hypothetical protein
MEGIGKRTWGEWAFLIGVILAVLLAFFPDLLESGTASTLLVVLGFLVGFWNIAGPEKKLFLLAGIGLLAVGAGGLEALPTIGGTLGNFTANITAFVAPAVFIVALKAVIEAGKSSA